MLLPSPEATEELPMNPFRAVRHPPRRPQHFQRNAFHEGKGWVSMLPRHVLCKAGPQCQHGLSLTNVLTFLRCAVGVTVV